MRVCIHFALLFCLLACGGCSKKKSTDELIVDGDTDIRHSAAIKLGRFGEQARDAIPALQKTQHDGDARVREAATKALSRIDPEQFPLGTRQNSSSDGR